MTSKIICPVCGAGTVLEFPDGTFACDSEYCKSYEETDTTTYDLLIQTKKQLDRAKEGLKEIQDKGEYVNPIELAESYLDEITALDQKEIQ